MGNEIERKVATFNYDGEVISVFSSALDGFEQKEKRWVLDALKVSGLADYEVLVQRVMRSNKVNYDVARAQLDHLVRVVKRTAIERKVFGNKSVPKKTKKKIKPTVIEKKKDKPSPPKKPLTNAELALKKRVARIISHADRNGISIEKALRISGAGPKVRTAVLRRRPR